MKKSLSFWLLIAFQFCILIGIVVHFEYIKMTGKTVYIEATGYDPVDIFRGDYVNMAYNVKIPSEREDILSLAKKASNQYTYYLIPNIENDIITWVKQITEEKPKDTIFIELDTFFINTQRKLTILWENGISYNYMDACYIDINEWQDVLLHFNKDDEENIFYIDFWKQNIEFADIEENIVKWIITDTWKCENFLTIRTNKADKFFVSEGEGKDIEKEIDTWNIFAEWKITSNGKIILINLVDKDTILQ